jgi:hypothetical protein
MILMKITDGKLEANWDEIKSLADAYDRGCRSEESYKAKMFGLIYEMGYTSAMDDMEEQGLQMGYLMTHTMGNA